MEQMASIETAMATLSVRNPGTMNTLPIQFEFPRFLATQLSLTPNNASYELRRLVAWFLYEHEQISLGKACELGNLSYWEFAELNRQWQIPIHYTTEDLAADMERLVDVNL